MVFYFEPDASAHESDDAAILAFIQMQTSVTAQQIASYLFVSHNTAIRKLGCLIKAGKIKKVGKGPAVKYVSRRD